MRSATSAGVSPATSRSTITWRWSNGSASSAERSPSSRSRACSSAAAVGLHLGQRHGTLRSQVVERSVPGDPQQPGREGGGAHPVMGERPRQAREDLAGDVLGVVLVANDRQHEAEDVVRVEQVQQAQRVFIPVTGPLGRGRDQRLRVRRMSELTAAPVTRPCRRRLETIRRTAHRHLSHSLRDEQPCPCPKSPPSLPEYGEASHSDAPELKTNMRPVDARSIQPRCRLTRALGDLRHAVLEAVEERVVGCPANRRL